jgi:hypothetical protein
MTLVVDDTADALDAHLAFHLNAGVDFVIASDPSLHKDTKEILEAYSREGWLRVFPTRGAEETNLLTNVARLAVSEHDADWVVPSSTREYWWPRGESLKDVLAVIPERYAIVQGLVRTVAAQRLEGQLIGEDWTARSSLLGPSSGEGTPKRLLRPVYRAEPEMVVDPEDWTLGGRRVPLRAWYPIEVFHVPRAETSAAGDAAFEDLIARGELAVDTRLRDALRTLRDAGTSRFALPTEGRSRLAFPVPNIVDDASYAVECAAVGEVDLVRLDAQIRKLELRIAALEARIWPRVRRALRRLARRHR